MTKVKLLFLYRFSVLSVLLHYKLLSGDDGRVRPHFYVLGWTEDWRGDIFACKSTFAERGARISKPPPIGLEMGWDPWILGWTKERKRQQFSTFSHWVFSMLKYITKVKLLFLYIFYVLYVLFHYKPLSGDGGRVRPHFYVLRWTENCRKDIFAFEATLAERGARIFLNRSQSASRWVETLAFLDCLKSAPRWVGSAEFCTGTKSTKRTEKFNLFHNGCLACLSK